MTDSSEHGSPKPHEEAGGGKRHGCRSFHTFVHYPPLVHRQRTTNQRRWILETTQTRNHPRGTLLRSLTRSRFQMIGSVELRYPLQCKVGISGIPLIRSRKRDRISTRKKKRKPASTTCILRPSPTVRINRSSRAPGGAGITFPLCDPHPCPSLLVREGRTH